MVLDGKAKTALSLPLLQIVQCQLRLQGMKMEDPLSLSNTHRHCEHLGSAPRTALRNHKQNRQEKVEDMLEHSENNTVTPSTERAAR